MESNTINRVVLSGTVSGKQRQEIIVGGKKKLLATVMLKQYDSRKKENSEKQKVNLYIVKGAGEAAQTLLALTQGQDVIIRGMLQARIRKEDETFTTTKILPYVFVPDADGVQIATGANLVNEATIFGRIYTSTNIRTKIRIEEENNYAHVAFAVQVGSTKKSQNPFSTTEPVNIVFVKYKPKSVEGFKKIKDRFSDKGRFVAVTGALISEFYLTPKKEKVYKLEIIARQVVVLPGRFVQIKEVSPEEVIGANNS